MKKVLLFIILAVSYSVAIAQHSIFMQILENKKICNREDQLTYFLQANSFERQNEDHYYYHYAVNGQFYTTCIINQNECYVTYQTNNIKDYNHIKATIAGMCHKEYAADKSLSYVCNERRIQDVQIMFSGYSQADKTYEILVYQNPEHHEVPYSQADRIAPVTDDEPAAKPTLKKKKRITKTTRTVATKTTTKQAPANATLISKDAVKPAAPAVKSNTPPAIGVKKTAPPVIK